MFLGGWWIHARRDVGEQGNAAVLTLAFAMRKRYFKASWRMADWCMAKIAEQGMPPGFAVQ